MSARLLSVAGLLAAALLAANPSVAQMPAARTAAPAAPTTAGPVVTPPSGLPAGHPPVDPPADRGQPPMRPGHDQQSQRKLIERLRRDMQAQQQGGAADRPALAAPRFPRDDHGNCIGQGPNDPPKNVNLFHGWLGVNNEKAVAPPPRRTEGETGWFAERFGSTAWWKWRLTPYPYRYENHDDECDPRNTPIPLLANIINFAVLAFIVVRFGRKPVAEALKKRRTTILSEVERAREMKEGAEKRVAEYQTELDHLDDRIATLRKQYADGADLEESRLREELGLARDRMVSEVAFRIDQEGKSTRDSLSREALEGALQAAESLLEKSVVEADHDRLCEEFIDQVGAALSRGPGSATGAAS